MLSDITMIAHGGLTLAVTDPNAPQQSLTRQLRFEIHQDGIRFSYLELIQRPIDIKQTVLFGRDRSRLSDGAKRELDTLVHALSKINVTSREIDVVGHTDNRKSSETNQRLSEARARSVVSYLKEKLDEPPREPVIFTERGRGDEEPKVPNRNEANRRQNRRAEITARAVVTIERFEPAPEITTLLTHLNIPPEAPFESHGRGYLILPALPASPSDAFYFEDIAFSYTAPGLTLSFNQANSQNATEPFGHSVNGHLFFKALHLSFVDLSAASPVTVNGEVTAVLLDHDVPLAAHLDSAGLGFRYQPKPGAGHLPLPPLGVLDLTKLDVSPPASSWHGLQVLYAFDEGQGSLIHDSSATGQAINLAVETPDDIGWQPKGLTTTEQGFITSAALAMPNSAGGVAPNATQQLIEACKHTNEITIAAWIKANDLNTSGRSPRRIVTLSKDFRERNVTLGQQGSDFVVRIRTTEADDNGIPQRQQPLTAADKVAPGLSYVVYTRERTGRARLYLNGHEIADDTIAGDLQNWEHFELALGNEFGAASRRDPRHWLGEFHGLAIYDRALTPNEVLRNYYPNIVITAGHLRLADVPVPLSDPLPATLTYLPTVSQLTVADTSERTVTPQFQFEQIDLSWNAAAAEDWILTSGSVQARLWGNALSFTSIPPAEDRARVLPLVTPKDEALALQLDGLGQIVFTNLRLDTVTGADWQVRADTDMTEVILPHPDRRPFDFKTDFKLFDPRLGIEDGRFILGGNWLGQDVAFYGLNRGERFALQSRVRFDLPFTVSLGPIYEPGTGVRVVDRIEIGRSEGERVNMRASLLVELTAQGFMALVGGAFDWEAGTRIVPDCPIYTPPTTQNAILEALIDTLKTHADDIFAPVFQHESDYFFSERDATPILYYGSASAPPQGDISSKLPKLFTTDTDIEIASEPDDIFKLVATATACTLIMKPSESSQSDLDAAYQSFFAELAKRAEPLGLRAGAVTLLQRRIAERLPISLDRLLYYYYGFDPALNIFDLQGGMRLRIDYQNYQFIPPSDRTARNGFVGSGTAYYQVNRYRHPVNSGDPQVLLGFDNFLSNIQTVVTTQIAQTGAGGVIDLLQVGYRKPYYRLFYPRQFSGSEGRVGAERVATLIGASSLNALQEATAAFLEQGHVPDTNDRVSFYFRGRAVVVPEISIFVQEQPIFVPIGTTLRQLLERYTSVPAIGLTGPELHRFQGTFRPRRLVHDGANSTPGYRYINLPPEAADNSRMDLLELPLVKGDRFYF